MTGYGACVDVDETRLTTSTPGGQWWGWWRERQHPHRITTLPDTARIGCDDLDHAEALAALLRAMGVPPAAVTVTGNRRTGIDRATWEVRYRKRGESVHILGPAGTRIPDTAKCGLTVDRHGDPGWFGGVEPERSRAARLPICSNCLRLVEAGA